VPPGPSLEPPLSSRHAAIPALGYINDVMLTVSFYMRFVYKCLKYTSVRALVIDSCYGALEIVRVIIINYYYYVESCEWHFINCVHYLQ